MEYIGKEKFGTFKTNGVIRAIPTRPWITDSYPGDLSGRGKGDIRAYASGDTCHIGNSDTDETYNLTWIHLKDGNKHLYISDRVIFTNVSWDYLNKLGRIYGTPVTIDGKDYKLRVLAENEWIGIIRNVYNISGLPMPTQEDLTDTNTYGQLDGQHNQLWNWWGIWTTCQETISGSVMERGYSNVNKVTYYSASASFKDAGWRPVLEYIEIDPPEKPIPVYPTSEDRTHPEPVKGEITLQTKYNGEGQLEQMDVSVYNYTQQKFEYQSEMVDNTTGSMKLPVTFKAGNNYKITVRHKGTGGFAKEWLGLYVIGGELGKYKLSEPITIKQFDPIKSYTSGESLVMKPQTFPETENSRLRLVPQVMNSLTTTEWNTLNSKELEYTTSTKAPVVGDRLIKDKEIYTISSIIGGAKEVNVVAELITQEDVEKPTQLFAMGRGQKSYVHNGRIYFPDIHTRTTSPKYGINIRSIALDGTAPKAHGSMNSNPLKSVAITGKDNKVYMVIAEPRELTFLTINTDTNKSKFQSVAMDNSVMSVSATVDSKTNHLVVATKELNLSTSTYNIVGYWFNMSNPDKITIDARSVMFNDENNNNVSFPYVTDIQDFREGNISISFVKKYDETQLQLVEAIYTASGQISNVGRVFKDGINAVNSCVYSRLFQGENGKHTWIIAYSYQEGANKMKVATYTQTKEKGSYQSYWATLTPEYSRIPFLRLTYDKLHGFMLLYSFSDGIINQTSTVAIEKEWGDISQVTQVASRDSEHIFEVVDYNPYAYGQYPGLLLLEYDASSKTDRVMLRSDYTMEEPRDNKLTLDKPISAHAGETIKFLDYDLEVKAGEEIATVKPLDITEDYYEYDAQFTKAESQRDINIKGRNTKLTTLYYYNY
ncbi:hypothetical protein EXN65_16760 [Clostridium botulinum]|uniref:hypothetical protein n=2 Tax=Clostridium botulinum TaxID=1491 RepID=UPI00016BB2CC|nr:hypothetical protein [Clostridium botulinum]EDT84950.1 probable transcriptional regulator-related protein [Clostridium botulinum Bf]MBY6879704.1 hypothetical protein [Clostridium botulinum]NFB02613.1 hypothetical protein [Clostridium botulinum]NFE32078.1 hypothetical protein [Clostridium botulinum]